MTEQEIAFAQVTSVSNYRSFEEKLGCHNCTIDNPQWSRHSDVFALLLLVLVGWAIGYSLFGDDVVGIHSQLFSLVVSTYFGFLQFSTFRVQSKCVGATDFVVLWYIVFWNNFWKTTID